MPSISSTTGCLPFQVMLRAKPRTASTESNRLPFQWLSSIPQHRSTEFYHLLLDLSDGHVGRQLPSLLAELLSSGAGFPQGEPQLRPMRDLEAPHGRLLLLRVVQGGSAVGRLQTGHFLVDLGQFFVRR